MAKTYTDLSSAATGSVLTATAYNNHITNTENLIVPAACQVRRTTNLTGYTSDAAITWESEAFDTDDMWASSPQPTRITINTAGLYLVSFTGQGTGATTITLVNGNISVNGTTAVSNYTNSIASAGGYFSTNAILNLAVNDYITCAVGFAGGSAYVVAGNSTAQSQAQTRCTVTWIGKTSL